MAGSSLLMLLDDLAIVFGDVVVMSKIAAKKTAGVLGDNLALNAQQVANVSTRTDQNISKLLIDGATPAAISLEYSAKEPILRPSEHWHDISYSIQVGSILCK